jgi:hypothetical protein
MKKINMFAIIALLAMIALPAGAQTVSTGLTRDATGSGSAPLVKAKWEMNPEKEVATPYGYLGTDDDIAAGAQFDAPGVKDQNRTIAICAIVTDEDSVNDIAGVYADVYYPKNIALGDSHVALPNQTGDGCGSFMQQDTLIALDKDAGIELFCDKIYNNNTNLPTFNPSQTAEYWWNDICAADGELEKETAKVFCAEKDLSYEDPSGNYGVTVLAQDTSSKNGTLGNEFTYLPLTAFDIDFTGVTYGNVKLNIEKVINGDLTFGTASMPTVRNVGNTRMNLTVMQDDMGLGKSSGNWNVIYKARVGNEFSDWKSYDPTVVTTLEDALDLSELDEVDFGIKVTKFPTDATAFNGNMTLGAVMADHLLCDQTPE